MQESSGTQFPPPPQYYQPRKKTRWWIPVVIIVGILVIIVGVLGTIGAVISSSFSTSEDKVQVAENTVLMLDLSGGVPEYNAGGGGILFGGKNQGASLLDVLTAIDHARVDPKIKGIYYKAGGTTGMAKLTEIREALLKFKKSGKFIYAFIEAGTKSHYYIASVADSIMMPEEGMLEFNAFGASGMFMKGLYDKIGVTWHVEQFEEYKSAGESMSRTSWSEPAKAEMRPIIEQRRDIFVNAVSASRNIQPTTLLSILDRGMYTSDSLKNAGLIDGFVREAELRERIQKRVNPKDTNDHPKLATVSVSQYMNSDFSDDQNIDQKNGIAIVYASGAIFSGKNKNGFDNSGIYAKSLISDLRKARDNDEVKAIILRIDSPGGSAIASDEIWAEINTIRKTKPVYASMSDVAASGGYYIAMACDTIVAHPATITGSIGVIMAIPNFSGTADKLGVTTDTVSTGRSSAFMNVFMPATDADKAVLHNLGSGIYTRFVQKMATSRKKQFEEARALAKGRVWTGDAAMKAGLVDVNGGLAETIDLVKAKLGVGKGMKVHIYKYPVKGDQFEAILRMLGIGDDDDDSDASYDDKITVESILTSAQIANDPLTKILAKLPYEARMQLQHSADMMNIGLSEKALMMLPTAPM